MVYSPGAVSVSVAVPRPKWKSSVPWKVPERRAAGIHADGVGAARVASGVARSDAAGDAASTPGATGAVVVGRRGDAEATAGCPPSAAAATGGSTSSVRMKTGDTRYQATGASTTSTTADAAIAATG